MLKKFDQESRNLFWLSAIAVIEGLFILIIAGWISSLIPLEAKLDGLFSQYHQFVHPERDTSIYRIFVVSAVVIYCCLLVFFHKRLSEPGLASRLKRYWIVQGCLLGFICLTIFKIFVYAAPPLAVNLLRGLIVVAFISKACWRWFDRLLLSADRWLIHLDGKGKWIILAHGAVCLSLFIALYVPDVSCVIAKLYSGDGFHHFDAFVMAPAWAAFKGSVLNVDHYSQYGLGMPNMIAALSRFVGGFSYESVLRVLVLLVVIYFILVYAFLHLWLRNTAVAVAGVLLAVRCQMFFMNADELIWQFPMITVVRYFFDIIFFILVCLHLRTTNRTLIAASGLVCGLALFYISGTGIYLLAAYYAYVFFVFFMPHTRPLIYRTAKDILFIVLLFMIPLAAGLLFIFWETGPAVLTGEFWKNSTEMIRFATQGLHAIPVMDILKNKSFFNFFMALAVLLTYLFTLIFVTGLHWFGRLNRESLVAAVLSVYGLCSYHYFVLRSTPGAYFAVSVPFVLILAFWAREAIRYLGSALQRRIGLFLSVAAILALLTTDSFTRYPHLFNAQRSLCASEIQHMAETFISPDDVALIRRLTGADERVCLISSFEVATLIASDRKPFFYMFNLVHSRAMPMREFGGWKLIGPYQFKRMMKRLSGEAPPYVFIEYKLISGALPEIYYRHYRTFSECVDYLKAHYRPVEVGKYLAALKRI